MRSNRRTLKREQRAAWSSSLPFEPSVNKQCGHRLHEAPRGSAPAPGHLSQKPNYRLSAGSQLTDGESLGSRHCGSHGILRGSAFIPSHKQNMASHPSPLTFEWGAAVGRRSCSWVLIKSNHLSPPSLSLPCPSTVVPAGTAARSLPTGPCPAQQTEGLIPTVAPQPCLECSSGVHRALKAWLGLSPPAPPRPPLSCPCSLLSSH